MSIQVRNAVVRSLLGAAGLLFIAAPVHAAGNWEVGKILHTDNTCTLCHSIKTGRSADQITTAIATEPQMARFKAGGTNPLSVDNISDIAGYLSHQNFPIAALTPASFAFGEVAVGFPQSHVFSLSNSGDIALNVGTISISDATNYSVSSTCGATVTVGGSCDITVKFDPVSSDPAGTAAVGQTLTVTHNNTFSGSSNSSVSAQPRLPVELTALSLTFTPLSVQPLQTTITDRVGGPIRICRAAGSPVSLSFPSDYSIDGYALVGDAGCVTTPSGAVGRTLPLDVRFTPPSAGPRNGSLTIQRVAGGALTTVQLQGNPGPFATVDAMHLFDLPGDNGVEIDNDNVLDRSFTLFSKGSAPLVFASTSFVISDTFKDDYQVLATGCLVLPGLPAFTTGTPASCQVTVRFNPSDIGLRNPARLTLQFANSPDNVVTLRGTGIRGPRLKVFRSALQLVSGGTVQFTTQTIGGLYAPITVTLHNDGTVGNLEVALPASGSVAGFTFTPGACASIAAGADCALDLHFSPSSVQAYATPLVIQTRPAGTSAAYDTFTLSLAGQASATDVPKLGWTDDSGTAITQLAFVPATDIGAPVTKKIRLYNDGPGGVLLQLANVVGLDGQNFVLNATDCANGKSLYEKTSCAILVQFAPGTPGPKTASIQFVASGSTPPVLVIPGLLTATGTAIGVAAPASAVLSPPTLTFADTTTGAVALPQELKLRNDGSRGLLVSGLDVAAPFSVQIKTCPALPFTLPPGNECSVNVVFSPQSDGAQSGILRVTTDGTPAVQEVALSAKAEPKANSSGGGCSIAEGDSLIDPVLWTMVLLALGVLLVRRRERADDGLGR